MPCVYKFDNRVRIWWLHTWTKWETIERGSLQSQYDEMGVPLAPNPPRTVGYFERQRRECECCGKRQLRKVSA
jgi:hypothetical protein